MIIKSMQDIEIPEWAKSITQDECGQICVFECSISDLDREIDILMGGYHYCSNDIDTRYDTIQEGFNDGTSIQGWEYRAYDLATDNVVIDNEILVSIRE